MTFEKLRLSVFFIFIGRWPSDFAAKKSRRVVVVGVGVGVGVGLPKRSKVEIQPNDGEWTQFVSQCPFRVSRLGEQAQLKSSHGLT